MNIAVPPDVNAIINKIMNWYEDICVILDNDPVAKSNVNIINEVIPNLKNVAAL